MKSLFRLITGSKRPKMKFASFGRVRDVGLIEEHTEDAELKARRIAQTLAAHDLNDGTGSVEAFIDASRKAVFESTERGRDQPLTLLARVAKYYPACLKIWDELARDTSSKNRFSVASRLYWPVPTDVSDRLFNALRHDRSKSVRDIAIDRYENRAGEDGKVIFGKFDANLFDDRVRRGEVQI